RRQLPTGVATHKALWIFPVQSGSDGHHLRNFIDGAGQPLDVSTCRRPRDAQGDFLHGAIYKGQEELASQAGRDVRRAVTDAAEQLAIRRSGFEPAGLPRAVEDVAGGFEVRRSHPEFLYSPT